MITHRGAIRLVNGLIVGGTHFAAFAHTSCCEETMSMAIFLLVDFPVSLLLFLFPESYRAWVTHLAWQHQFAAEMLDPITLVNGVLGTIWWAWIGYKFASVATRSTS